MVHSTTATKATTLLIVHRYRMIREMLTELLTGQEWVKAVQEVGSLADAKVTFAETNPSVVLLDVSMPDGASIEWARQIKQSDHQTRIVFLADRGDEDMALAAIAVGAEGYVAESSSCHSLLDSIRAVISGNYAFDPAVTASIIRRFAAARPASITFYDLGQLSAREREIADLVAKGFTNYEVAKAAFVSVNTVKTHLRRIYQRLGISSRRELRHYHHGW